MKRFRQAGWDILAGIMIVGSIWLISGIMLAAHFMITGRKNWPISYPVLFFGAAITYTAFIAFCGACFWARMRINVKR